jgi:hypothetical protein
VVFWKSLVVGDSAFTTRRLLEKWGGPRYGATGVTDRRILESDAVGIGGEVLHRYRGPRDPGR